MERDKYDVYKKYVGTVLDDRYLIDELIGVGGMAVVFGARYSYINNNYNYLSMYGLDISKPLDEQPFFGDPTKTWQQFFLETAISMDIDDKIDEMLDGDKDAILAKLGVETPADTEELYVSNVFITRLGWSA